MHLRYDPQPVAERIWCEVGYRPGFPRDLLQPLMEAFEVAVIFVPTLSIASMNAWLVENRRAPVGSQKERALKGCLLARKGRAFIFLDGSLDPAERRLALAHEWAHFFAHYLEPRRRAIARLGSDILPALDGERQTTVTERLSGIIQGVPIGPFQDYLSRDEGGYPGEAVLDIETEADLIALELLAPCREATHLAKLGPKLPSALATQFGLPPWAAAEWARFILRPQPRPDPVILGIEQMIRKKL